MSDLSSRSSNRPPQQPIRRMKFFTAPDDVEKAATRRVSATRTTSRPYQQNVQTASPGQQGWAGNNGMHRPQPQVAPGQQQTENVPRNLMSNTRPDGTLAPKSPVNSQPPKPKVPRRPRITENVPPERAGITRPDRTGVPDLPTYGLPAVVLNRVHGTENIQGRLERVPGVNGTWIAGAASSNGNLKAPPTYQKEDTFPMMVLKGVSTQQGQSAPVMKSEISGAAGSAAIVGVGTVAGNVFKYGNNFLIQRGFGAGPTGLYAVCFSIVTLVSSIFNLGLDDAMIRYVSIYRGKKQPHLLRGLTIFCSALAGITGILGAFIVLFLAPYFASIKHSPGVMPVLQMMVPFIPLTCMQVIWSAGLQGFKAFKWRVLTQRMIIPAAMFVLLAIVVLFFRFLSLTGIVLALLISTTVGVVVSFYFFFKMLNRVSVEVPQQYEFREWFSFAAPNFLTSIVDTVLDSTDTLLLAFFAISNVAIGQYAAAIKISVFIALPLQSLNVMFTPTIAELYSKGEIEKLKAMFKIVTKWVITFSLPIFWIAALFSKSLLSLSGNIFGDAWPLLVAFSIGGIVNAGTGSVGYMLLMTGHQKLSFLNSLAAVVVNVILGIILTPRYGAMGTAIATGLAICVINLMRLLQVRLILKMQPYRRDTLKPILAGFISAAITGVLLYLVNNANLTFKLFHVVYLSADLALIPVFLALYGLLLAAFKLGPEDQIVVSALRKKFKRGKK